MKPYFVVFLCVLFEFGESFGLRKAKKTKFFL